LIGLLASLCLPGYLALKKDNRKMSKSEPATMKDQGFYDQHSQIQLAIIAKTTPFIEAALAKVSMPKAEERFTIVDYGSSEGRNAVAVVNQIMEIVRKRKANQLFSITFNDLPTNNFNKLFENIYYQELMPSQTDPNSILTFASAQPFYSGVMPTGSVHFGYSASAAHWLSTETEATIHSHVYVSGATDEEKLQLAVIAGRDWHNFLYHRAVELTPGGRLLVTMAAKITDLEEARHLSQNNRRGNSAQEIYSAEIVMNLLNEVLEELVTKGKISRESAQRCWFPLYPRSRQELLEPLNSGLLQKFFEIEHLELQAIPCPLFEKYQQTGNSEEYAESLTDMIRAFTETVVLHKLCGVTDRRRSSPARLEAESVINEIYSNVKKRIKKSPEQYTFFPIQSILVLARK
jgi:hypothetical protein